MSMTELIRIIQNESIFLGCKKRLLACDIESEFCFPTLACLTVISPELVDTRIISSRSGNLPHSYLSHSLSNYSDTMPTSIPYDPSLTLMSVVNEEALKNVEAISKL